jgi:hypothetical protein
VIDMDECEERPVHTVVDCSSGAVTHTPLTDDEWAEHRAAGARAAAEAAQRTELAAAAAAQRTELAAAAAAHPDPLVRELAARAGLL